jgi:diacylglycerol kinase family enzyme
VPIPAILNCRAGTADALRDAIRADDRFRLEEVEPDGIREAVERALRAGAARVAVGGGDGSVVSAASVLLELGAEESVELAVLPAGTLNHFARHLGIPVEPADALAVAATGAARAVDAAFVRDRLFVNTSSVGSYVAFVRLRERLEPRFGYWLASLLAGLRLFFRLPRFRVEVEVEGQARVYETPLVFVGVGERTLTAPGLSELVANGRPGLHVIVVRGRRRARILALGLAAARGGARAVARMPEVDSFVVARCRVTVARDQVLASTDGEVVRLPVPLDYRSAPRLLRIAAPAGQAPPPDAAAGA